MSPDQAGNHEAQSHESRRTREKGLEDAIPDVTRIDDARVERLRDLRLEPGLLMEADLEVGEQNELRARYRVDLETRPLVARERLSQVTLPVGRLARSEPFNEPGEAIRADAGIGAAFDIEAGELAADLLEHPQVAAGYCGARAIQRGGWTDDRPDGREQRIKREVGAEPAGLGRDLAPSTRRVRR